MSVLRQPSRVLLPVLVLVLCLVSALTIFAQSEAEPSLTSEPVIVENSQLPERPTAENDAVPEDDVAETTVIEPAEEGNRAISIEVSPADKTWVEIDDEPRVILDEGIPSSNADMAAYPNEKPVSGEVVLEVVALEENTEVSEPVAEEKSKIGEPTIEARSETAVEAKSETALEAKDETASATAELEPKKNYYFESSRGSTLAVILILLGFVTYYTFQAQRGREMFIRRISGLSAIEDAVGRATEMGRGVLYVPGIMDMDDIQTIAGVTILGHVSRKTAEYDTDLYAPMSRSFVMSVAQEVVKQAYMEKGRVDAYRPDRINYLTDDQFGYVAGVGGIMMRDKPAACFYLGTFYAESLILAETGNAIGAIQIAGTAEPSQIPFFVASCDYTLIGEELFAASAYLSKNPREVGSLKGQDMVKVVIIIAIIVGTLLVSIANTEYGKTSRFAAMATTFMEYLK